MEQKYLVMTEGPLRSHIEALELGYEVVSTITELLEHELYKGDMVLVNSLDDTHLQMSLGFRDLGTLEGINVYYVAQELDGAISIMVSDIGGHLVEDEYFIEHPEELIYLSEGTGTDLVVADELDNMRALVGSLSTITDLVTKEQDAGLSLIVTRSLAKLEEELTGQVEQREVVEELLGRVLADTDDWQKQLEAEKANIEAIVENLKTQADQAVQQGTVATHSMNLQFPTYMYNQKAPVIVFKEYSNTRYLTSFVQGFRNWLSIRGKVCRVLVVDQPGDSQIKRYRDIPDINRRTYKGSEVIVKTTGVVTEPFKDVMDHMFTRGDKVILVIDRMYREKPFVQGTGPIYTYHAFSGMTEYQTTQIKKDPLHALVPIISSREWTTLQHIQGYKPDIITRENTYIQKYAEVYQQMYNEFSHLV